MDDSEAFEVGGFDYFGELFDVVLGVVELGASDGDGVGGEQFVMEIGHGERDAVGGQE